MDRIEPIGVILTDGNTRDKINVWIVVPAS